MGLNLMRTIILLLAIFLPTSANAQFDEYLSSYLDRVDSSDEIVFYADCLFHDEKVGLILEPVTRKGLLVELNEGVAVNLAKIELVNRKFKLVETHGGMGSYDRVGRLLELLLSATYSIIPKGRAREMLLSKKAPPCVINSQ